MKHSVCSNVGALLNLGNLSNLGNLRQETAYPEAVFCSICCTFKTKYLVTEVADVNDFIVVIIQL